MDEPRTPLRTARPAKPMTSLVDDDGLNDFRTRQLMQQSESAERRRRDLIEQSSDLRTPTARILIWERLHQTRLPRSPDHGLVAVIATATRLTEDDVRAEQRLRFPDPGS